MKEYDADGSWVERGQYLRIGVDSGDGDMWDKYGGIFQVKVIVLGEILKIVGKRIWASKTQISGLHQPMQREPSSMTEKRDIEQDRRENMSSIFYMYISCLCDIHCRG